MAGIKATVVKLPTVQSEPLDDLAEHSMLWYGREKIGKTSLAAMFPNAIFLMCEPGGKGLTIFKVDISDWYSFKGAVAALKNDKRYRTVVVDTVDKAYDFCQDAVCTQLAIDHPSDEEWGKGWGRVKSEFSETMTALLQCGKGVIFTSHAVEREIKRRGGNNTTRVMPTMAAGARAVIEPMVDIWAYMAYDADGTREMMIRGDDVIAAGHRLRKRFIGIDKIPMGKSPEQGYKNFMVAWNTTPTGATVGKEGASAVPGPRKMVLKRK